MTNIQQQKPKRILVLIEMVGEHYWAVLIAGLSIIACIIAYGYFAEQHTILMAGIYAALAFVFAPPAILMSSYLLSRLLDLIRKQ